MAGIITSHELARILLANVDLPIATHANNHTYISGVDSRTHGSLRVAILETYGGQHILIGNPWRDDINPPNWYISSHLNTSVEQ